MFCNNCGAQLPDGTVVCTECHTVLGTVNVPKLTKKEFLALPQMKKVAGDIKASAIMLYVCAAFTLLLTLLMSNFSAIIDVILVVGFGLGIQFKYSRGCAIATGVYAALNVVVTIVTTGRIGGWLLIVAAIYSIISTKQLKDSWEIYQQTGMVVVPESKKVK